MTDQLEMRLQKTVPLLFVSDIEASVDFYCEGLGFSIKSKWEPKGKLAYCWLEQGGAALMLQQATDENAPRNLEGVTIYFICDDADVVYHQCLQRNVELTEPSIAFYGMNQTFVSDPDGYELCFENPTE